MKCLTTEEEPVPQSTTLRIKCLTAGEEPVPQSTTICIKCLATGKILCLKVQLSV